LKAAVLKNFNTDLDLEELDIPDLKKGQILVDIKYSGICGAQVNQKKGIKIDKKFLPCLMGHEGAGIVLEVGQGVTKVNSGDHVVLHWRKSSGLESDFPKYYSKTSKKLIGAGLITTFSEKSVISENRLTKIDKKHSLDIAALLGCAVTTGIGIVENELRAHSNSSFLIAGVGGVGLSIIMGANLKSPSNVIALDLNDEKLAFSKTVGSTHQINILKDKKIIDIVNRITDNKGVDYVVDTTGNEEIIDQLLDATATGGSLVLVGQPEKDKNLSITNFLKLFKGITIFDSQGGLTNPEKDIPHLLELHENGVLNLDLLINKRISLENINEGFNLLENHKFIGSRIIIEN